jgi:predicted dehydrogenase
VFAELFQDKPKRVGLIGCGWYGKIDLLRLIQVSPVEVVSLCDVDKKMLADAADIVASRQVSKKKPRTFGDYRQMLAEKDLDIVLVGTPDHWHALPAIAAMQAGADVWCQKPISVDVTEGLAMLTAARKYKRVVQIGIQRRSTPHLVEARDKIIKEGKLGKIGLVEIYNYGRTRPITAPDEAPPENLDYEFWTGPAPMRPFTRGQHPQGWRAYMEYGNGTLGDMGVHMFDMVRWMMGLGWPQRISSSGGLLVAKGGKNNIADTQTAVFEYDDLNVIWQHRMWGDPPDPKYTWGATFWGERGSLKASVYSWDYTPSARGEQPLHQDVIYELEQYPEDKAEPRLEKHCAPAVRYQMKDFLANIATRGRPVADIEEGYISTTSCILANNAMKLGRTLSWDPKSNRVIGDEEANRILGRPYRRPWVHPTPDSV